MNTLLSAVEMTIATALGFACALGLAAMWLRAMVGAMARNSYNVTDAPAAGVSAPSAPGTN